MIRLLIITRLVKKNLRILLRLMDSFLCLAIGEPFFRLRGMRRGGIMPPLPEMQQILVLRLDQIGDVVMTVPLLRELRKNAPQARITLVVKPELRDFMSSCPYVDEVLTFDWHVPTRFLEYRRRIRALRFCFTHLWRHRFDLAIIPRWDADWYCQTFLAYFSGSCWRIAYSEDVNAVKQVHNRGYDSLMTHVLHQNTAEREVEHEVERDLNILREIKGEVAQSHLELWPMPAADAWAGNWLQDNIKDKIGDDRPVIAFGPFVGNSALKLWPFHNFAALGRWLLQLSEGHILILGGAGDQSQAQQICDEIGPGAFNLAGQCSLSQTAALLKRCALYVGDDSGPMHLASAAGIPVIALFGPSCPHRFAPWNPKRQVLWKQLPCSPCIVSHHADCCTVCIFEQPRCIQSITVEEVQEAIKNADFLQISFFLPSHPQSRLPI